MSAERKGEPIGLDQSTLTYSTIDGRTCEEIGGLIQEHFDAVTLEQFIANNRRWNPHLFTETSQVDKAK